jgi:hypothetical protein
MRGLRQLTVFIVSFGLVFVAPMAAAENEDLTDIGDVVQLLLPAAAWGVSFGRGDREGALQFTKAIGGAVLTTQVGKRVFGRLRPNASNEFSFPSGHTTAAFVGAEFMRARYNKWWSVPGYLGAGFVGWSRVQGEKHFADDVLAGASVGLLWNWYMVSPAAEAVSLMPSLSSEGVAVNFEYNFKDLTFSSPEMDKPPKVTYTLEVSQFDPTTNDVQSPSGTGTLIDFAGAQTEPGITSRVFVAYHFNPKHQIEGYYAPLELIDYTAPEEANQQIMFGGVTFGPLAADEYIQARFRYTEARLLYRYTWVENLRWHFEIGGGLNFFDNEIEIFQAQGQPGTPTPGTEKGATVSATGLSPAASARLKYKFSPRWSLELQGDGIPDSDWYANVGLKAGFKISAAWDVGLGARWIGSELDTAELYNKVRTTEGLFQISYSFF